MTDSEVFIQHLAQIHHCAKEMGVGELVKTNEEDSESEKDIVSTQKRERERERDGEKYKQSVHRRRTRRVRGSRVFTTVLRTTKTYNVPANDHHSKLVGWSSALAAQFLEEIQKYAPLYDQFKIVWVKQVNTVETPSTLSDDTAQVGQWYKCYDRDSDGHLYEPDPKNYLKDVNTKWGTMKPFESQSIFMRPTFAIQEWFSNKAIPLARQNWWNRWVK